MTEQEKLDIMVECPECDHAHSLNEWVAHSYNHTGIRGSLKLDKDDPEDIIEDVMFDCPNCDNPVYLSDGCIC